LISDSKAETILAINEINNPKELANNPNMSKALIFINETVKYMNITKLIN
jgi:hypothetical protein